VDVEIAIDQKISPTLIDSFGPSFANCLLTMATLDYVTAGGGRTQRYRAFVDSICSSDRVLEEWGEERAERQCREWKDLVPLEPEPVVVLTSTSS
jgi:hypothetical protein